MAIGLLVAGESGASVRGKINSTITEVNIAKLPLAGGALSGKVDFFKGANIAAAATTDLATATGNVITITGNTGITSFGTLQAGAIVLLKFTGTPTITYNATSMILPTADDIVVEAGDTAIAVSNGSGNWEFYSFQRASGKSLESSKDFKDAANLATAAALPANTRTANVITADANGALTVDGTSVTVGMRLLVKDEAAGADNGIYDVTAVGDGSNPYVLTRSSDADTDEKVTSGMQIRVISGTANTLTNWTLTTADPITVNTTALTFEKPAASITTETDYIYVDSIQGVDSTGRGQEEAKYATVNYALTDINNTGTFTGDTNTNTTVNGITDADYANLRVGQIVFALGDFDYRTTIESKDGGAVDDKAITVSRSALATSSGVTITWYNPITIKTTGPVTITSNINKEGVGFDFGESQVFYGAVTVINRTALRITPEYVVGGHWYGTNAASRIFEADTAVSSHDAIFRLKSVYSIGTNEQFDCNNNSRFRNLTLECPYFDARFGKIAKTHCSGTFTVNMTGYGVLGGITDSSSRVVGHVDIESPTAISALICSADYQSISGNILGSVSISPSSPRTIENSFNQKGTNCTLSGSGSSERLMTFNGSIEANMGLSGNMVLNGTTLGNISQTSGDIQILNYKGSSITISGSSKCYIKHISSTTNPTIDLNGSAKLTFESHLIGSSGANVNIEANAKLITTHLFNGRLRTIDGTIVLRGSPTLWNKSDTFNGTLISEGAKVLVTRDGTAEGSTSTPTVDIGATGSVIVYGGSWECDKADSKSGIFRKSADGSVLSLMGNPYLKVANGLAPIQITSNTGTAQDVYDFDTVANVADATYIAAFSDTTYGTAYAPNFITTLHSTANNF